VCAVCGSGCWRMAWAAASAAELRRRCRTVAAGRLTRMSASLLRLELTCYSAKPRRGQKPCASWRGRQRRKRPPFRSGSCFRCRPLLSPPSSNAPNIFYRQHHQVEAPEISEVAFRPAWRRRTRLDSLLRRGEISAYEYWAVLQYRDACERTTDRALASTLGRVDMPSRPTHRLGDGPAERMRSAAEYLARIREALGPTVTWRPGAFPKSRQNIMLI
jgi:hypothetical protein